jgi:EmrB/QacA subfamily drug resistance transporter
VSRAGEQNRLDPQLRRLVVVVVIGSFLSVLDMTVVNVALRTLSVRLHGSVASVQWVVTSYTLALAAAIPVTGWASRRFGARRVYIVCLAMFTFASGLCGLAWSIGSLAAFRALQGLGGGAILPVAQTIVGREAGPKRMARTMAITGSVAVMAPVVGPIVGGFIIDHFSWRWVFMINLPVGIVALVLAWLRLPRDHPEPAWRLDVVGLLLMSFGLPAFTYALAQLGQGSSIASLDGGVLLALSVVALVLFVWHALRIERPLLNVRLFANRTYAIASATSFALGAAVFGPYLVMPLFFQQVQGASPMQAGALFAAQGVGAAFSIRLGGILSGRASAGTLASCGTVIMIVFTLPLVLFDQTTSHLVAVVVLIGRGFGIGLAMIPTMAAALAILKREQLPDGTAQTSVLQRIGASLATAGIAVLLTRELTAHAGTAAASAADTVTAYQHTQWASVALAVLVLPCALALRRRQARQLAPIVQPAPAVAETPALAE